MLYLDSSALVKLAIEEDESEELASTLLSSSSCLSSVLAKVELLRAVARFDTSERRKLRAVEVLQGLTLVRIDQAVVDEAALLEPPSLRSLDAIHLATALLVADDLDGFVTYDSRLAAAADKLGLPVVAPGSE